MSEDNKRDDLEKIRIDILQKNICPNLAEVSTQLVMGDGNSDADIVFIGEAPGRREDEIGRPFVGASGKLLDELLASIELSREDIYITNIVKYRPPNNRDPLPDEKAAFLPYLLRQLLIIQPKIIVTLGRHSMEYFLPGVKISQTHGRAVRTQLTLSDGTHVDWLIMPLYHPAAALYNGSLRKTLFEDIQFLGAFV